MATGYRQPPTTRGQGPRAQGPRGNEGRGPKQGTPWTVDHGPWWRKAKAGSQDTNETCRNAELVPCTSHPLSLVSSLQSFVFLHLPTLAACRLTAYGLQLIGLQLSAYGVWTADRVPKGQQDKTQDTRKRKESKGQATSRKPEQSEIRKRPWTLDPGPWTLDRRNPEPCILDLGSWILALPNVPKA